ncbi:hypothetical protein [Desulfobacter curvatus]|uniref:hypothetical protein n=1 Tax=Desulfobacter curvatus TaxID=2290 RepID=UPI00036017F9|nr:hypothetical protein [Desulfobacter curvatus]
MPDKPDDRIQKTLPEIDQEDLEPQIYIIVNNKKLPRPGLETFFSKAETNTDSARPKSTCAPVGGSYCSCNKVCTCVPVCGCVGNKVCSCVPVCGCVGHTSSGGGGYGGCRCAPVH